MSQLPGEFEIIERIRASVGGAGEGLVLGIGDDCAVTAVRPGYRLLSTIDAMVEEVHFRRSYITPRELGYKALAVNLSDIAAMGGIPRHALISLCIPDDIDGAYIDEFYLGMHDLASAWGTTIAGGNISSSRRGFIVNVVLLGEVEEGKALLRSGAGVGDLLFVTGVLGLSAAGLELLTGKAGGKEKGRTVGSPLSEAERRHLTPAPRVDEGRRLLESGCATAAIDLSDGLASDLRHLCDESGVGAVIRSGDLPLPETVSHSAEGLRRSSLDYAIFGGEDYELLVTVEKERAIELQSRWDSALVHITEVGIITEKGEGINLLDEKGNLSELPPGGWDHFGAGPSPG